MVEGRFVDYAVVAEAYRELEAAGGRLALIDRMAALLGETPDDRGCLPDDERPKCPSPVCPIIKLMYCSARQREPDVRGRAFCMCVDLQGDGARRYLRRVLR